MNNRNDSLAYLEMYDLGEIGKIYELQGGMFLKPIVVESKRGKFVLRLHTFRSEPSLFEYQAEILYQASLEGLLCPQVIRTEDGSWGFPTPDGYCALHEYVEGVMIDWKTWYRLKIRPGFLEALGRHVAKMHDILRRIKVDGKDNLDVFLPPIQFDKLETIRVNWRKRLECLKEKPCASEPAPQKLLEVQDQVEVFWDKLEKGILKSDLLSLNTQPVHGDISAVNLIFNSERTDDPEGAVFIDWDCVHKGPRIYDALGDILLRFPSRHPEWNKFSIEEIERYLNSYNKTSEIPLQDNEIEAIGICILARQLEDLRQRLQIAPELSESAGIKNANLIDMRMEMMDQIKMDPNFYLNKITMKDY
jgi:Ser/Thr protein kinase RdoA (MazF antagonist)